MRQIWLILALCLALAGAAALPAGAQPPAAASDALAAAGTAADTLVADTCDEALPPAPTRVRSVSLTRAVGFGVCDGVRPGGYTAIPQDLEGKVKNYCTLNFFFVGVDRHGRGHPYMGTAGHCAGVWLPEKPGEKAWRAGTGPRVEDGRGKRIGEIAYAVLQGKPSRDFALIRLDRGVKVSTQMCWFGGPTGWNDDRTSALTPLHHYGNGIGVGEVVPARTSYALGMPDPHYVYALGLVVPADSGGPVISSDGRAVGVVVTLGGHYRGTHSGTVGITRLRPQVRRAERVLGQTLHLGLAPLR
jgi:hypothetical protein